MYPKHEMQQRKKIVWPLLLQKESLAEKMNVYSVVAPTDARRQRPRSAMRMEALRKQGWGMFASVLIAHHDEELHASNSSRGSLAPKAPQQELH